MDALGHFDADAALENMIKNEMSKNLAENIGLAVLGSANLLARTHDNEDSCQLYHRLHLVRLHDPPSLHVDTVYQAGAQVCPHSNSQYRRLGHVPQAHHSFGR